MYEDAVNALLPNLGVWLFRHYLYTLEQTQGHLLTRVLVLLSRPLAKKKN